MRVLLISMPFGALERQALGLSLLKAAACEHGHDCRVRYFNLDFADLVGLADYVWLSLQAPYTAFAGDWTFTEALYGPRPAEDARYVREILRDAWRLSDADVARILRIRRLVGPFLDFAMQAEDWSRFDLVGFTSTFEQNIASLALAARLKAAHPGLPIVFGGANWEAEMGQELHARFPFVDYVCSGEAELSFPALLEHVEHEGRSGQPPRVPGVVSRHEGRSVSAGPPRAVAAMDDLPVPDYDDYFAAVETSAVGPSLVPSLLFETARGCWWGARNHCTFCGLNGSSMAFRSKSQPRALEELEALTARWRIDMVEVVDNILDLAYFGRFLPALARRGERLQLFYEVKANLTRAQLRALSEAGVRRIQPGIESLSDHVLQLMRKGTTGLANVQLLKWCREYGIRCDWNLLYGFPGETREDYARQLELLRRIRHLGAPSACGPLRLDRFSPYHRAPRDFGLTRVRPLPSYRFLYPFPDESLMRLAYYFEFDYAAEVDPRGYADEVVRYCAAWKAAPETGSLVMLRRPDGTLALVDGRAAHAPVLTLTGLEQAAYEFCDQAHTAQAVLRHLRERFPGVAIGEGEVRAHLESACEGGIMVSDGKRYLGLAEAREPLRSELERQGRQGSRQGGLEHAALEVAWDRPKLEQSSLSSS
jgi:ribosomal peptide maturation radical SAM protein 1